MSLPAEDERVRNYVTGKSQVRADLRVLGARVHVPGVINIFDALLVCLRDTHIKKEGVLCERYEINFRVDDVLCPRDEIPLEHEEGVSEDVLGFRALHDNSRELAVRRERQIFFSRPC